MKIESETKSITQIIKAESAAVEGLKTMAAGALKKEAKIKLESEIAIKTQKVSDA